MPEHFSEEPVEQTPEVEKGKVLPFQKKDKPKVDLGLRDWKNFAKATRGGLLVDAMENPETGAIMEGKGVKLEGNEPEQWWSDNSHEKKAS